jgi:hypothetical protein
LISFGIAGAALACHDMKIQMGGEFAVKFDPRLTKLEFRLKVSAQWNNPKIQDYFSHPSSFPRP